MKTRRALSSVVGIVFAIIALSSTFVYISYSMNTLSQYNQSVVQKNQQMLDIGKEKFQIFSVTVSNGKLNMTVANTGTLPINFTKLWVQNTSATDWTRSYVPKNGFVIPGGTLKNIGQDISNPTIRLDKAYNAMLVTSRGNAQQFTINSANSAPLNIQLLAIPPTVSSGFKSELVMIVTNNGSSILTNIAPAALPTGSPGLTGLATCTANSVSPASYNTILPGSTAIFKWDVTVTGTNGQTCTYTLNQPLQNGYTQTVQATITVNVITFTQTNLAQNTGILTMNYTSFRWVQGGNATWNTGWTFHGPPATAFSVDLTNNNSTGDFYVYSYSQFAFQQAGTSNGNNVSFFIVNATTLGPQLSVTGFSCTGNEYCIKIPSGQKVTLNFAASSRGSSSSIAQLNAPGGGQYYNMMLMYGKYATSRSALGTFYAQSIPFIAVHVLP